MFWNRGMSKLDCDDFAVSIEIFKTLFSDYWPQEQALIRAHLGVPWLQRALTNTYDARRKAVKEKIYVDWAWVCDNEQVVEEAGTARAVDILVRKFMAEGLITAPDIHVSPIAIDKLILKLTELQKAINHPDDNTARNLSPQDGG